MSEIGEPDIFKFYRLHLVDGDILWGVEVFGVLVENMKGSIRGSDAMIPRWEKAPAIQYHHRVFDKNPLTRP